MAKRNKYGSGAVYQVCDTARGCPPVSNGERPPHECGGKWRGAFTSVSPEIRTTCDPPPSTSATASAGMVNDRSGS